MDMVEGRIFWDAALPGVSPPERAALFDAMNATIADLHSIDHVAAGLADYGRPGNYFERPIEIGRASVGKVCVSTYRSRWSQEPEIQYTYTSNKRPGNTKK